MPTLNKCMKLVNKLVVEKEFYNKREYLPLKLLFAFIELGEASDAWKKGLDDEKIAEEIIDVIFYLLDAYRFLNAKSPDIVFNRKWRKNMKREKTYGEGHRKYFDLKKDLGLNV